MKSRLTLGIAGLLFVGAIIAGYQGVKLSQHTAQQTPAAPAPALPTRASLPAESEPAVVQAPQENSTPVVVLATELAPGVAISAEHLRIEQLHIAPPRHLSLAGALAGVTGINPLAGRRHSHQTQL